MRYLESKETSGEMLRLALPHIARHGSGFQPTSYTVWYEYVAGTNPPLTQALDAHIAKDGALTPAQTHELYSTYIAACDADQIERLHLQLQQALDELGGLAGRASNEATDYGRSLQAYGDRLVPSVDIKALRDIVCALAAETKQMQQSNRALGERLEASRRDFLELKRELASVQNEVLVDPLTGLKNRRGLQRGIDEILTGRPGGLAGCALLMADIDHFKKVNDTHGHLLGDRVLQSVAQVLLQSVKGRDLAARFGGEEFAILLPDTHERGATALAEQIRQTVARGRIRRADRSEPIGGITISLGVAAYEPDETPEQWIARADQALYQSKQFGRDRVTLAVAARALA
jgi:diguanylate cyclase